MSFNVPTHDSSTQTELEGTFRVSNWVGVSSLHIYMSMMTLGMFYNKNKYSTQNYFSQEKHINLIIFFSYGDYCFWLLLQWHMLENHILLYLYYTYACIDTCITNFPF